MSKHKNYDIFCMDFEPDDYNEEPKKKKKHKKKNKKKNKKNNEVATRRPLVNLPPVNINLNIDLSGEACNLTNTIASIRDKIKSLKKGD